MESTNILPSVLNFIVLLYSIILHEISHGTAALALGDTTAKDMGRLSLNPIRHIDLLGTILLPMFLVISAMIAHTRLIIFGWAKPVPYNPYNLKKPLMGAALIAMAGPLANFSLAFLFAMILRFSSLFSLSKSVFDFIGFVVLINCILGVFNLIPIPPFDGSKILFYFTRGNQLEKILNRFSFFLLIFILLYGFGFIYFVASGIFKLFTGFSA